MEKRIKVGGQSCWEWSGCLNPNGYGVVTVGKSYTRTVHGLMYFLFYGQVPSGLELHHKCRNKRCVNPEHLEMVDDLGHVAQHPEYSGKRTHCVHGHEYTTENTYVRKDGGRSCRECNRLRVQQWCKEHPKIHGKRPKKTTPGGVGGMMEPKEKVVWEDRIEVPMEEVELEARDRAAYAQMFRARARKMGQGALERVKEEPIDEAGVEAVREWAASRKNGVSVDTANW